MGKSQLRKNITASELNKLINLLISSCEREWNIPWYELIEELLKAEKKYKVKNLRKELLQTIDLLNVAYPSSKTLEELKNLLTFFAPRQLPGKSYNSVFVGFYKSPSWQLIAKPIPLIRPYDLFLGGIKGYKVSTHNYPQKTAYQWAKLGFVNPCRLTEKCNEYASRSYTDS